MIVWVQLPALKIHFYHKEVLTMLGNLIGRTIKLDFHTLNRQRAKFARLAVEVDLSKDLVPRIWLDDAWQKVEYENLPVVCFDCEKIGHTATSCPHRQLANPTTTLVISGETLPAFGPWMRLLAKVDGINGMWIEKENRRVKVGNLLQETLVIWERFLHLGKEQLLSPRKVGISRN
ncbi:unnamed protein product [Linum tenue]|uniref:CCHC-type domain-containing protein n=1 Tax=Linum tenue TaxID=586396 RepID=A0AAV0H7T8_9ROSI|nr:unnamed protein product [Linum tenue]